MMSSNAVAKMSKGQLASRWQSLQRRYARGKEIAEGVAERGANSLAQGTGFGGAYVARRVMKLKGMKTGFGSKQQLDGFLLAGLITAVIGVTPMSGKYGSLIASFGTGVACAGSTDLLDQAATYLHTGGE